MAYLMNQMVAASLIFNICLVFKSCSSQKTFTQPHLQPPINPAPLNIYNGNNNRQQSQSATTISAHASQAHITKTLERPNLPSLPNSNATEQNEVSGSSVDWLMLAADDLNTGEGKNVASFAEPSGRNSTIKRSGHKRKSSSSSSSKSNRTTIFDDEQMSSDSSDRETYDDVEEGSTLAGTLKEPECAARGRYYCTYKEDYPLQLVTEVTRYYKWPLEKLFRDLHAQIMPKLAKDSSGNLVCDSITRVVRPGWARNTNDRWLVVINTENYHQYVTEVVCQYGPNSRCNFIPPCYYASCQQRYNTQKLLVIDPTNPYRGPFLSEFLFPSCCVCYVPSTSESFQDKYRSSPATIYQRTIQQEAASNMYPPHYKPTGLLEELPSSFIGQPASSQQASDTSASKVSTEITPAAGRVLGPGEIRRGGEQYKRQEADTGKRDRFSSAVSEVTQPAGLFQ